MSTIVALLQEMRGRLGMYLGSSSLTKLAAFLRGYDLATERGGRQSPDPFLPAFRDWIHHRFGSAERSWEETIQQHSADESAAVKRFWELFDEYLLESSSRSASKLGAATFAPVGPQALTTNGPRK
jgi:hypothetical protein